MAALNPAETASELCASAARDGRLRKGLSVGDLRGGTPTGIRSERETKKKEGFGRLHDFQMWHPCVTPLHRCRARQPGYLAKPVGVDMESGESNHTSHRIGRAAALQATSSPSARASLTSPLAPLPTILRPRRTRLGGELCMDARSWRPLMFVEGVPKLLAWPLEFPLNSPAPSSPSNTPPPPAPRYEASRALETARPLDPADLM